MAKNLFYYDYLTADEMKQVIEGKNLKKEKVRTWTNGEYLIRFWNL